jgi:hypothetical protein
MRLHPLFIFLVFVDVVLVVDAIVPPEENYTTFVADLHRVRRRSLLPRQVTYRPRHISPANCWLLTDEECQQEDEAVATAKRRGLVNRGTVKVLVVLCRFKDHATRELPPPSYYEELFNGKGPSEVNPIGSVREYLLWSSQGRYNGAYLRAWNKE